MNTEAAIWFVVMFLVALALGGYVGYILTERMFHRLLSDPDYLMLRYYQVKDEGDPEL